MSSSKRDFQISDIGYRKAQILAKVNVVKRLKFVLLLCGLSALPTLSQGSRFDLQVSQPATLAANPNVVPILPNATIAGMKNTGRKTSNGPETVSANNSFSGQFNPSNPCSIDGIIWVSAGGCYTTIASALTALGSAPGTIVVPPGTWTTPATIAMTTSGQHIQCAGIGSTIISYTGGSTTAIFDVGTSPTGSPGYVNISINGCTISGNANVQYAIRTRGVHHSDFSHNSLINVTAAGIQTNFGVALILDDLHSSFNEQVFTVQPQSCIILDGPDTSHKTTTGTVKTPICEGVSGTGIVLNNTADMRLMNGTSEQNNRGLTISTYSQNAAIDGTDFESNAISDIENSGNQTRLTMITSLGLTRITGSAYYARLDGGLYNSITVESGALDTHLEKFSYNNYGTGALTDNGIRTSKFRIVNLAGGGVYDDDGCHSRKFITSGNYKQHRHSGIQHDYILHYSGIGRSDLYNGGNYVTRGLLGYKLQVGLHGPFADECAWASDGHEVEHHVHDHHRSNHGGGGNLWILRLHGGSQLV